MSDAQHPIIARRRLLVTYPAGNRKEFEIQIDAPFLTSDDDYCCGVRSGDVLFAGTQRLYGVDAIDAVDYAIQFIDTAFANFCDGEIQWPDGTAYKRLPSSSKFDWGG